MSDKIKEFRKKKGITQKELSKKMDMDLRTYWNKENFSKGQFTFEDLVLLKKLYPDLDMNWLLTKEN